MEKINLKKKNIFNKEEMIKKILIVSLIIFIFAFIQGLLEAGDEAMSEVKRINKSLEENNKVSKEATKLLELQLELHELEILKSKIDSLANKIEK
jgi:cell division protein FtsB